MVAVQNLKGEIIQLIATVFHHAHLQVVYYKYVKFHKNSISNLVGVALTRYMPPPPLLFVTPRKQGLRGI
jgi:hypothetical protein